MRTPDTPHAWRANVAAIITDGRGNVLLGGNPEKSAHWHFPQGGIKHGESPQQALMREIREEVGLSDCRIVAEFPGLRYAYRKKNIKSHRWLGQQQIYYLLEAPPGIPECSGSTEFSEARWFPIKNLSPELFVSFKRAVVAQALAHYFRAATDLPTIEATCSLQRYLYRPGSAPDPAGATPLFAGAKAEAAQHMSLLPPARTRDRLLVVLIGMEGSGAKKALRHIAHTLDPLSVRYCTSRDRQAQRADIPLPGEIAIHTAGPYADILAGDMQHTPTLLHQLEQARLCYAGENVRLLKIALYLSGSKQARRLADKRPAKGIKWSESYRRLLHMLDTDPAPEPWYLLPADHGWYRDYLLASLIRSSM